MGRNRADRDMFDLTGDKLYQKRARLALPILVRQAKAEQPIYYADLAEELGMPNPRNLDYVLGAVGNSLQDLSKLWKIEIPPIQALVRNQTTDLPGKGFAGFAPNPSAFRRGTLRQKRDILKSMLSNIYHFKKWDEIVSYFNLKAKSVSPANEEKRKRNMIVFGGSGETEDHRRFKELIAHRPQILGLSPSLKPGKMEYAFGSGDAIDVLFDKSSEWLGVEVKALNSNPDDIERGIYQCVKYRALVEATMMVSQVPTRCRIIMALEGAFPWNLIPLRNTLGVEVVDELSTYSKKKV